jgi:transcriptional regulator with XRE-family HTH domain
MYAYYDFYFFLEFPFVNNTRDKDLLKEFGQNFRRVRKAKKFTQKNLAFEADVEVSQIYRIENGIINPTVTTILLLAEAMGVPPSLLFDYKKASVKK